MDSATNESSAQWANGGMVSTAHVGATAAGVEILEAGGNAVDAAVAAAFALGVCEPAASGLGGQTMMLIHLTEPNRTFALDGSSRAPDHATTDAVTRRQRRRGHTATTVPSTAATLRYALEEYGTLDRTTILTPAIRLAEEGYQITPLQNQLTTRELKHLKAGPAGRFFLQADGTPYPAGSCFRQPVLAATLRRLADKGIRDFYSGRIAHLIHEDMVANGGLLREDDLAQVPRPIERPVLSGRFRGRRVHTFPPPAAGRTLLEMLNIYQRFPRDLRDIDDPRGAVALAALTHQVLRDRRDRPFDPNCYAQITEKRMLQANYANLLAKQIAERVNQGRAGQGRGGGRKQSGGETTHLSVMDRWGNAVGLTQSIEHVYGSCAVSPKLGFLYNSYMSAFEYKDPSHPYYLRPNAVPWASVAPTIVFRGRRPWVVLGSPGSERITSAILQVLIRLLHDDPHHVYAAVDAPRLHCALSRVVSLESTRMDPGLGVALEQQGFKLRVRDPYAFYLGCVALVMRTHEGFLGVADPRRDGAAAGPSFTNTQHGNHAYE